jgi:endonuclease/exonuclease/phosphatase family metal-dependent hydrolase
LKIATWNAEWMSYMFRGNQSIFYQKNLEKDIPDVDTWAKRKSNYIKSLDPDILGIQEGPKTKDQMNAFVKKYLSDSSGNPLYSVNRNEDGYNPNNIYDKQYLYLLIKNSLDLKVTNLKQDVKVKEMLYGNWIVHYWGSVNEEQHRFWRRPLVAEIEIGNEKLKIIITHNKSLFLNKTKEWAQDNPEEFTKLSMKSRIKLATEAWKIRQYMDQFLEKDPRTNIILMGDLNDGPGQRYFERNFLFQDMIDVLIGTLMKPEEFMRHGFADYDKELRYTAKFSDWLNPDESNKLLLDHILLSPSFFKPHSFFVLKKGSAVIDHEKYEKHVDSNNLKDRPSDHRAACIMIQH